MSISTILLAVAVVVEFVAAVGFMKLYKEAVKQIEQLVREIEWLKHKNEALGEALVNARRQISKLHKRDRRRGK